jgi:RNA-directed DNA polymerase
MKEAYGKRRTTGMRKGMREPYVEDIASHGGPESCVGDPRGRSEALTGVHAGRLLSLENSSVQGADAVVGAEGNIAGGVIASRWRALRGRRTRARARAPHAENREISRSPLLAGDARAGWSRVSDRWAAGREGNAEAVIPR